MDEEARTQPCLPTTQTGSMLVTMNRWGCPASITRSRTYPAQGSTQGSSTQRAIEGPFEPGELVFPRRPIDPPKGRGGGRVDWVHILRDTIRRMSWKGSRGTYGREAELDVASGAEEDRGAGVRGGPAENFVHGK